MLSALLPLDRAEPSFCARISGAEPGRIAQRAGVASASGTVAVARVDVPRRCAGDLVRSSGAAVIRVAGAGRYPSFEQSPGIDVAFRSEVECGWRIGDVGGRRILHLETYGSAERRRQSKLSQAIDLDEAGARQLLDILRRAFPGLA